MTFSPAVKVLVARLYQRGYSSSKILEALEEDKSMSKVPTLRTIMNWCQQSDEGTVGLTNEARDSEQLIPILEGLRARSIDAALALKIRSVDEATRAIARLQRLIGEIGAEQAVGISDADLNTVLKTVIQVIAADNEVGPMLRGKEVQWLNEIKAAMVQVE